MKIYSFNNQVEWQEAILKAVFLVWRNAVEQNGKASIGLAGGKTPFDIYYQMGKQAEILFNKTTFFLVDERKVAWESPQSNHHLLMTSLVAGLIESGINEVSALSKIGDFTAEGENSIILSDYANWLNLNIGESPDLCILGVGADGHFASIFPGFEGWEDHLNQVFVTHTEQFEIKERLTVSPHFIISSKHLIILLKGKEKKELLVKLEKMNDKVSFPSAFLKSHANLKVFYTE